MQIAKKQIIALFLTILLLCPQVALGQAGSSGKLTPEKIAAEKKESEERINSMVESARQEIQEAIKAGKPSSEVASLKKSLHTMIENLRKRESNRIQKLESELSRLQLDGTVSTPTPSEAGAKKSTSAVSTLKSTLGGFLKGDDNRVNRPVEDKWALIVGISKFKNPKINLKYAAKDAQDFRDFLIKEANFAPDHVLLLKDQQATRSEILGALGANWLPRLAHPNDLVILYLSTHGSPSDYDVGGVNYLIAHDTEIDNLYGTGIPMQDLTRMIKKRVHSDRIVLLLDACHSGATSAEGKGILRTGNIDAESLALGTGQLVISSSTPSQRSWESKRTQNGIFTKYLIESLKIDGHGTKLGDAFNYLKNKVQDEVLRDRAVMQTPVLKSKWKGNQLLLSVIPTAPRPGLEREVAPAAAVTPAPGPAQSTSPAGSPIASTGSNRIAIVSVDGPVNETKQTYIGGKTTQLAIAARLPSLLRSELVRALQKRFDQQVLSSHITRTALQSKGITRVFNESDMQSAGSALGAKHLIKVTIYDAIFKQRFWTGNDFILKASIAIYSGDTGKPEFKSKIITVKKWPWVADQLVASYDQYWMATVVPEMARKLVSTAFPEPGSKKK